MQQRNQRRSPRAIVALVLLASALSFLLLPGPAAAQDAAAQDIVTDEGSGQIRILEVSGLLDPVVYDFLIKELDLAEADGVLAVMLQVDSNGSVLDQDRYLALARRLRDTELQVIAWVGPSGSSALGGTAELLGVADIIGVAIGSRIGDTGPARLPQTEFEPAFGDATSRLEDTTVGAAEAIELGIAPGDSSSEEALRASVEANSVLREFVRVVDGFEAASPGVEDASELGQVRFRQLSLSGQLFHTVASPEVAYLFFVGGMMLLVFELFTAGVGVAGVIGAALFVLGSYGLSVLPTRTAAVVLLVGAILAFAVDIQTNIPRVYTAAGMMFLTAGTFLLYDGLSMSWITILFGLVGGALYAYSGMPSMVRTRFSTPTIGRSWMIGEMGEAVTDLKPDGMVQIQDAKWRAMTNRATPVTAGDRIRVVGIDRLVLEVEPEEGGAKDYRDRG